MLRLLLVCLIGLFALAGQFPARAEPSHAIAMHGTAKLPPGFTHFPYVSPDAPKGGRITLGASGSYDNLNPMIVRGEPVQGIREFVVEPLMARSQDEPFTLYGLLAESIDVPPDRGEVTFRLNPAAHFSDGKPVTADDVIFSFEVLRDKGRPNYRTYYKKVSKIDRISDHEVRFVLAERGDREMPLILGLMPVLPRHAMSADTFDQTTLVPIVGSGPYRIARVDAGRSITYERDPNYWGRDLPVNRGRFNFDEIRFDYFREDATLFEAFKTGAIDLRNEDNPALWAQGYTFPAVQSGSVIRAEMPIGIPAGMTALVFNTRKPVFSDPRVREALILLFNFEWINSNLYHGLYKRTQSFFARSILSSNGKPADDYERKLLEPWKDSVLPAIMDGTFAFPESDQSGHSRANARKAFDLLASAGYVLKGGTLVNAAGEPLTFEILATSVSQERLLSSYASDVRKARHPGPHSNRRQCAIPVAAQGLRLRHDPVHVAGLAVARQRATVPLVVARRHRSRIVQLRRRSKSCCRCHDLGSPGGRSRGGFRLVRAGARPRAAVWVLRHSHVPSAGAVDRLLEASRPSRDGAAVRVQSRHVVGRGPKIAS